MKAKNLPPAVRQLFWGDDLHDLSWEKYSHYMIQTILEKGDKEATQWLFQKVSKRDVKASLNQFHLTPRSKNFWEIYL